jgi:hypothetical protein
MGLGFVCQSYFKSVLCHGGHWSQASTTEREDVFLRILASGLLLQIYIS